MADGEGREKHVTYGLKVYGELPPGTTGEGRGSQLQSMLNEIVANPSYHGQAISIAEYENPTAASAAANVLRQKNGRSQSVSGWLFATRAEKDQETGEKVTSLFAIYNPGAIVPGELEKHEQAESERKARLAQKRQERAAAVQAEEGNGESGTKSRRRSSSAA